MDARVPISVVLVVAASAVPLLAADDDWKRVIRLEKGTPVIVSVDGAEPLRGELVSADPDSLELAIDGPSPARVVRRFARATIVEVKTPQSTSTRSAVRLPDISAAVSSERFPARSSAAHSAETAARRWSA